MIAQLSPRKPGARIFDLIAQAESPKPAEQLSARPEDVPLPEDSTPESSGDEPASVPVTAGEPAVKIADPLLPIPTDSRW